MGILFNTVSICQFRVVGDPPGKDLYEWASERLAKNSFQSIDNTTDEVFREARPSDPSMEWTAHGKP